MPYQGADYQGYVPSGNYGSAFPNGQPMYQEQHQYGQAPPGSASHPQYGGSQATYNTPSVAGNAAARPGSAYTQHVNYPQAAYSTPQYYGQASPPSYYQTPANSFQSQHLSPSSQAPHFPRQYSPDPLQYYQAPPQAYSQTPSHTHPQQQRSSIQQYRQPQTRPQGPQQTPKQSSPGLVGSSHTTPARPLSAVQANVVSSTKDSRFSQHMPPRQRPHQQRAPPSPEEPVKVQDHTPTQSPVAQPNSQQRRATVPDQIQSTSAGRQRQQPSTQHIQPPLSHPQPHQSSDPQCASIDPSVLLSRVAHVERPAQRQPLNAGPIDPMARLPKRRKSNDGKPNPVCEPESAPQHHARQMASSKQKPSSFVNDNDVRFSQISPVSQQPSIDYQAVLLNLSDEYINAAYSMTADLETNEVSEEQLDRYHDLLSTGMGCLDAVLKRYHLSDPRKEARIRLRYASLLHEETENDIEAEEILSKGISICQRAKLPDLQYAMHHLSARLWFKAGKTRAALKTIDKLIADVEKLNMVHWIYTFRFLRVSLALQKTLTNSEIMALVRNLTAIRELADGHGHVSASLVASTLEALVHLRSRTPDSVELAQRALAHARMHQTQPEFTSMPEIILLLDCIDLGCALSRPNQELATSKNQAMQKDMDEYARDTLWSDDGVFLVPLCQLRDSAIELERDTCSILQKHKLGETICALPMKWLTRNEVYALGFLMSGLGYLNSSSSSSSKEQRAEQRAERFLNEGLNVARLPTKHTIQSLASASAHYNLNRVMRVLLRLYVVFAYAGRADWQSALKGVGNIHADVKQLASEPGRYVNNLLIFLEAICRHGLGELDHALQLYQSPQFKIEEKLDPKAPGDPIKVLAALNSVPIMRLQGRGREPEVILTNVSDYCLTHTNSNGNEYGSKPMEAALYVLKAMEPNEPGADNTIIKTKHYLQSAIAAAKSVTNNRLLSVVMSMMTAMFFGRIVGDQAEKSSRAGRSLARKSQDKLWIAVADNMFCNTLEKCGKIDEANVVRQEAQVAMASLSKSLQASLLAHGQHHE